MPYKTFSQKSARVFEIVGYVLLIPAAALNLFTLVAGAFLVLIPLAITAVGIFLLIGYRKHWRGTLEKRSCLKLWFATLIFNAIPLIPLFHEIVANPRDYAYLRIELFTNPFAMLPLAMIAWWIVAVSLSITHILDDLKNSRLI